ncbi:hypothetical protein AX14_013869 [Amanita brunnescens Koide BX004]|nr:hypothetical protein AX14_013869 [Amanita brunnescens Koide BX004]
MGREGGWALRPARFTGSFHKRNASASRLWPSLAASNSTKWSATPCTTKWNGNTANRQLAVNNLVIECRGVERNYSLSLCQGVPEQITAVISFLRAKAVDVDSETRQVCAESPAGYARPPTMHGGANSSPPRTDFPPLRPGDALDKSPSNDPTAALEALQSFDHDHFLEAIGSTIRKCQELCQDYCEKAQGKTSFRNLALSNLAPFLPATISVSKPRASFTRGFSFAPSLSSSFPTFCNSPGRTTEKARMDCWPPLRGVLLIARILLAKAAPTTTT